MCHLDANKPPVAVCCCGIITADVVEQGCSILLVLVVIVDQETDPCSLAHVLLLFCVPPAFDL